LGALIVIGASCVGVSSAIGESNAVADGVARAKAEVQKYSKKPKFVAPGPALTGKSIAKGKTIFIMAYSTQIPYNAAFNKAVTKYAKQVGFKVIEYPTSGVPDQWNRGIDLAISKKVDAIDLTAGLDARAIIPAIKRAQAAGIPVLTSTFADPSYPTPSYVTAGVGLGYVQAGRLEANYAIWKTNGKGNFLSIDGAPGIPPSLGVGSGQSAALKANCPQCKVKTIGVPIPQWATNMTPQVQAALKADPSINYILPFYDSQALYVIPALNTLAKKIPIAGFNGTPEIMALVRKGTVTMDVSEDVGWAGAATVDSILRVLGKVKPNSGTIDEHIPLRVFDSSNIKEVGPGLPPFGAGFGGAELGYLKLWGVK
jgi:ribose transport system substrate-binding protein